MSSINGNLDIKDDGALEAGKCLDAFIKEINSHITGACMIPMKLPKKEMVNLIYRSKEWFYKHYEDSVQENYYVIDRKNFTSSTFKNGRSIPLPGPRPDGSGRIFSVNNLAVSGEQMVGLSGKYGFIDADFSVDRLILGGTYSVPYTSQNGENLMYYVITEKYFDLARHVLINKISFNFNRLTNTLRIMGERPRNHVILEVYETIDDCSLFQDEIFFRYVAATVKRELGRMIMTFSFNMPGNTTLNGDMIRDDGQQELDAIVEEIKTDEGTDWFMTT